MSINISMTTAATTAFKQKQSPRTCILNLGTFLCRPLQNSNVKWPNLRFCREQEQTTVNFSFSVNLNATRTNLGNLPAIYYFNAFPSNNH